MYHPKINYRRGDLFALLPAKGKLIIPHVVNDLGRWGSGFVVPLGKTWPSAKSTYLEWAGGNTMSDFALGNVYNAVVVDEVVVSHMLAQKGVISYSNKHPLDYKALEECMTKVGNLGMTMNGSIHCPLFGSGLAGGNWKRIEKMVVDLWVDRGIPVTCYHLE